MAKPFFSPSFCGSKRLMARNNCKAVFLDRDGTISRDAENPGNFSEIIVFDFSAKAIAILKKAGFMVIVITNQAKIARGLCSEATVKAVNKKMVEELAKERALIDSVYYCPHHPTEATVEKYKKACECRKPGIGMLKRAQRRFGIDFSKSYFVGDSSIDIQTGKNAGCKTVLVQTGHAGKDLHFAAEPDFEANDLLHAAKIIIAEEKKAEKNNTVKGFSHSPQNIFRSGRTEQCQ